MDEPADVGDRLRCADLTARLLLGAPALLLPRWEWLACHRFADATVVARVRARRADPAPLRRAPGGGE